MEKVNEMSTQVMLKTGDTIQADIRLLGVWAVAKTETQETLGARIAGLRKDRGMTQAELAERLQVSQPVVSDYENDVIRIPADVVVELAKILNASTDEILGLKADISRNATIKNRRLLRQVQSIDKLSKRDQEALLRTIDAFLSKA
jgi:transcriptional regulator with XRE-family HTH domain